VDPVPDPLLLRKSGSAGGGGSVGIVRVRTKATEFNFSLVFFIRFLFLVSVFC